MFASLSGLLAGILHVLSGPDHLAAVLPLAARVPTRGRVFGALWGLGHGGGMLLWLSLALLFRQALPLDAVSGYAELLVGISLVGVGLWALRDRHAKSSRTGHERATAVGLGVLHGTAGAGHLFGVLPLLGLSPLEGTLYCLGFASSGVAAMALAGTLMGRLSVRPSLETRARPVFATLSFLVGISWIANAVFERISAVGLRLNG